MESVGEEGVQGVEEEALSSLDVGPRHCHRAAEEAL